MSPKKSSKKLVPGAGLDVGTANIVVSRQTVDGSFVNKTCRNMLFELPESDESADLLERGDYLYAKCDGKYFVIGKDALSLVNALGGQNEVVRPMKDGLLNPDLKQSQELLFQIIKTLVGEPLCENEPIRFSVPANPVDDPEKNNIFHQMMIQSFLINLGYSAEPLNEAMGVVYDCNPVMDDNGKVPLTGFGISMGGGMFNVAGAYKGISVCEFSVTKSGDYIDRQAANVTSTPVSKVTKIKETKLDLNDVDFSDRVIAALSIYYDETIKRAITNIKNELSKTDRDFEGPCEIILAGGTSMIKGTADRFKAALAKESLPFDVLNVRMSKDPFFSVAQGMCMRALSDYEKKR